MGNHHTHEGIDVSEPKRKRGGQAVPEDQRLLQRSIRLTAGDWEEFEIRGGLGWLRGQLKHRTPRGKPAAEDK